MTVDYWTACGACRAFRHERRRRRIVHREPEAADAVVGMKGAGDRAGRGDAANLADTLGPVAADFIRHFDQDDVDVGMCFARTMPMSRSASESGHRWWT